MSPDPSPHARSPRPPRPSRRPARSPRDPRSTLPPLPADDRLIGALCDWFRRARRDLPWRDPPARATGATREPYPALVAEFMLQQTQVSRVLEKFAPFLARFPTARALASAPEDAVLAAWSGLGYYRRARLLQAAARALVERHGGEVPADLASLRELPGVGRYTAGAIASIVFNRPAPIVDGNVARVLLRLEGREETAAGAADWLWTRAEALAERSAGLSTRPGGPDPATFNESLMELGALVCTPRAPRCLYCPVADLCAARAHGTQERIPLPKAPAAQSNIYCDVLLARDAAGRTLVERRPDTGLWAGLWQAPTLESSAKPPAKARPAAIALEVPLPDPSALTKGESFTFQTTHRKVHFTVWRVAAGAIDALAKARPDAALRTPAQIATLAMSSPQRRILVGTRDGEA